jgi:hypothetical protein
MAMRRNGIFVTCKVDPEIEIAMRARDPVPESMTGFLDYQSAIPETIRCRPRKKGGNARPLFPA